MKTRNQFSGARAGVLAVALGALLAGCGGGGSSNDGTAGGPSTPGGGGGGVEPTELPALAGLEGDADNQDLLYFTQPEGADPGLYALDPAAPETSILVDDRVLLDENAFSLSYDRSFLPIHEATLNDDGSLSDFRVDRVLYFDNRSLLDTNGFHAAATDVADPQPDPVSSEDLILLTNAIIQYALDDADNTSVLYELSDQGWYQFLLSDDENTDPLQLAERFTPVAPVLDPDLGRGAGYLVIDSDDDNRIKRVGMDLELEPGQVTIEGVAPAATARVLPLGGPLNDGAQYLVISGEDSPGTGGLFLYRPEQGDVGTLEQVVNGEGDPLVFNESLFPPPTPALPAPQHLTRSADVLFFAMQGNVLGFGDFDLVRVEGAEWRRVATESSLGEFVIASGDRVAVHSEDQVLSFALDGSDRRVIDSDDSMFGQDISTPVLGTRNGWIFYNRDTGIGGADRFAVANRLDGSDQVVIADASWVGASTTGTAPSTTQLDAMEVSEVFMLRNGTELAAVNAAMPAAGAVRLGQLPDSADQVRMYGLAPGPHRLLQAVSSGAPETLDVLYVNTRQEDSLRVISEQSSGDADQRPVKGF